MQISEFIELFPAENYRMVIEEKGGEIYFHLTGSYEETVAVLKSIMVQDDMFLEAAYEAMSEINHESQNN